MVLVVIGLLIPKDDKSHKADGAATKPARTPTAHATPPTSTVAANVSSATPATGTTPAKPATTTASTKRTVKPKAKRAVKRKASAIDPAAARQRYFIAMDDLAIHLDTAVGDMLDGKAGALSRIKRFRTQILNRTNKWLLAGHDTSIGSNLLLSAATDAREAAIDADAHRLVRARTDIVAARDRLAQDLKR